MHTPTAVFTHVDRGRSAQIGDEDTGKNRRIDQRVLWMTEAQKKTKVVELLRGHDKDDRVSTVDVTGDMYRTACVIHTLRFCRIISLTCMTQQCQNGEI